MVLLVEIFKDMETNDMPVVAKDTRISDPDKGEKSGRKNRKEQSEEEFLQQKKDFFSTGPVVQTEDWLFDVADLDHFDTNSKIDRTTFLHACEKAYYLRNYQKCLDLIRRGEGLFGLKNNDADHIKESFNNANRKAKKSAVADRHIVELLHIKEKCLEKLHVECTRNDHGIMGEKNIKN